MRGFFKGWRRKTGCPLLAMALVLLVMWIRSLVIEDEMTVTIGSRTSSLVSTNGGLYLWVWDATPALPLHWMSVVVLPTERNGSQPLRPSSFLMDRAHLYAPYPLIFIPLTLVAAWLILWKPQPTSDKTTP